MIAKLIGTLLLILFVSLAGPVRAQDSLTLSEQFAALEASMDSVSLLDLIDSLLSVSDKKYSELNLRVGYNSNALSAGRNYGINQHSISPGVTWYHHSGIFLDATGFWNSQSDPKYNLSILSAGYMASVSKKFSYTANYERWIYQDSESQSLNNSLGSTMTYTSKLGYATVDYGFLFGKETAHRIIGNLSGKIPLGKFWIFQSLILFPSGSILFGNEDITLYRFSEDERAQQLLEITQLRPRDIQRWFIEGRITREEAIKLNLTRRLVTSDNLTPEQEQRLTDLLYEITESNRFGIMNYSFGIPLMLSTQHWSFVVSFTYSIPVKLPGEEYTLDPIGFFGTSITYRIPFQDK